MKKIKFDNVVFDTGLRELASNLSEPVQLRPLPADALLVLLEHPNTPVSKEMLIERCWSSSVVTDQALTNVISKLRKALTSVGAENTRIKTITKLGYVFETESVVQLIEEEHGDLQQTSSATSTPPLTELESERALCDESISEFGEVSGEALEETDTVSTESVAHCHSIVVIDDKKDDISSNVEVLANGRDKGRNNRLSIIAMGLVTMATVVFAILFGLHFFHNEFFDHDEFVSVDANSYFHDSHLFVEKDFGRRTNDIDLQKIMVDKSIQNIEGCEQSIYLEVFQALFDHNRLGIKMYGFNKKDRGTINVVNKEVEPSEISAVLVSSFREIRKICQL
ncbi:hypothetical protein CS022_05640 [Veronia nyctiphanis]|uniref:OmpR/PhoB-type domain-containing protein n=1 Tax=Veronia nyctiphanis TaxID=1278244 RepID=A0A4Q0YSB3_9GAMM|nr:winged helix-turn-helix domain-containing protein [Veronia nyctiphanis]RXJ74110.1 hypothetical protein CS022_05640 [Veronia nyctiphanis]